MHPSSQKIKALEERVPLGTRSERVPQTEERGRNEITFFKKERSRNDSFLFRSLSVNNIIKLVIFES